jgi:hypothetical protein
LSVFNKSWRRVKKIMSGGEYYLTKISSSIDGIIEMDIERVRRGDIVSCQGFRTVIINRFFLF